MASSIPAGGFGVTAPPTHAGPEGPARPFGDDPLAAGETEGRLFHDGVGGNDDVTTPALVGNSTATVPVPSGPRSAQIGTARAQLTSTPPGGPAMLRTCG
jgi:hypothetical protein